MKKVGMTCGAAAMVAAGASAGDIYSDEQNFLGAVGDAPYLDLNTFDDVHYGYDGYLGYYRDDYYRYSFSAAAGLFCGEGNVSTKVAGQALVIDFSDRPVVAIGGDFWVRDANFKAIPAQVTILYSDGTKDVFPSDAESTFRGYVSGGVRINQLQVTPAAKGGGDGWIVLDNFYTLGAGALSDEEEFLKWVDIGFFNPFDDVGPGPVPSLSYGPNQNGFAYTVSAPSGLFCGQGVVSTATIGEPMMIDPSGNELWMSGGNIWVRDDDFQAIPGRVRIVYSDGVEDVFESGGPSVFRGYLGHEPITAVKVFAVGDGGAQGWPAMDNLWVESNLMRSCFADCDLNGTLDLFDFLCFIGDFNAHIGYADCDGNGVFDLFDFLCYQNSFNASC